MKALRGTKALGWAVALAVLLLTWRFYTQPDFMVKLADLLWACL